METNYTVNPHAKKRVNVQKASGTVNKDRGFPHIPLRLAITLTLFCT